MSTRIYQRTIPLLIMIACIAIILLAYFFPVLGLSPIATSLTKWTTILMAFAYWIGATSIVVTYGKRIIRKARDWYFSAWVLITLFGTILMGQSLGLTHSFYISFVSATVSNFSVLLYAMMIPFLFSAGYRALKIRSIESAVLVITMVIVYIGQSPAGAEMVPITASITEFVNKSFATGTGVSVLIANAFGAAVLSVRALLGKEPGLLGQVETKGEER